LPKQSKRIVPVLFWALSVCACILTGYFIAVKTEAAINVLALIALIYVFYNFQRLSIYLIIFLPVIGEMYRLSLGSENGLIISDLVIPVFAGVWVVKKIITRTSLPKSRLTKPFLIFCIIAVLSLLQSFLFIKPAEVLLSSLYLIRLASYTALILIVIDSVKDGKHAKTLITLIISAACLIAVAGFIQLVIFPNMSSLESLGWDPHINRLVSTWLDPNFIGGYLSFIICLILGITLYAKKTSSKIGLFLIIAFLATALFLTYSRSAYVALAAGLIVIGLIKSRKLLLASLLIFLAVIAISPRASERVTDLTHSISSIVFDTAENPDATARLRIQSWEQTWELIYERPLLGSGYNTLRYAKYNEGFVQAPDIHSASGSDSSLLTILATTGLIGIIPFIWFYCEILLAAFRGYKKHDKKTPSILCGLSLGLFTGIISLLIDSLFVNSLLFPQILIPLLIAVGINQRFVVRVGGS
jgi:O-antigen ligase